MKRILSILSCALLLTTAVSCDWFVLDNQEGWDAQVTGKIIDAKTGKPVQSEQGAEITVVEQGWKNPVSGDPVSQNQSWKIKNDGTFISGQIHSFIQKKGIGPRKDLTNTVAKEMKSLSEADIQNPAITISSEGEIRVK